jgi:hypothetical protein
MAGDIYDSCNFEGIQLKIAWIKNIFLFWINSSQNVLDYILFEIFIRTNVVFGDFKSKYKSFHLLVVVFLCIRHMTPRQPIGVGWGRGGSKMEFSLLPIGP